MTSDDENGIQQWTAVSYNGRLHLGSDVGVYDSMDTYPMLIPQKGFAHLKEKGLSKGRKEKFNHNYFLQSLSKI